MIAFVVPVLAHQKTMTLPREVMVILDNEYTGWSLVDNFSVLREPVLSHLNLNTSKSHPNLVWGDFDGDGKRDYAVFVERKTASGEERLLVAFLRRSNSFQMHLLERAVYLAYIADYIWLAGKGSRQYDHERRRYFRLEHDGIEAVVIEKASVTYIFQSGRFQRIITTD